MLHIVLLAREPRLAAHHPRRGWKPAGDEDPTWRILGLLGVTIGLPYFLLSTTGPLVQAWFARSFPAGTVYRLFALSNFGSLLALVSYPFAFEPWITTRAPVVGLERGLRRCSSLLCAASARLQPARAAAAPPPRRAAVAARTTGPRPRPRDYGLWLLLSAMGSFMLLAVTNHITHDVASVPFLWILPLTLYLAHLHPVLRGARLVPAPHLPRAAAGDRRRDGVGAAQGARHHGHQGGAPAQPGRALRDVHVLPRRARRRGSPRRAISRSFYLMVSLGGALGGLAVGLIVAASSSTPTTSSASGWW